MGTIIFPCGCHFKVCDYPDDYIVRADTLKPSEIAKLSIDINIYKIPMRCSATWKLFATGFTKGIFQLESYLGKSWSKKVQPTDLEDVAALVALLRPGCLKAMSGDPPKSMTQRYADRKARLEDVTYYHPDLEPILRTTFGVLVYQEQAMKIAVALAGFNEQEADVLRKAIGKKKPEIMSALEKDFIEGCAKKGLVTKEEAGEIFGWIRESQRYSFNKCLSPTTIVETKSGHLETLDDVTIGEQITSPDGWVEILNKYDNGTQEVYEITLESGKSIQCTLNHQFLCSDGAKHTLEDIFEKELEIMCGDAV